MKKTLLLGMFLCGTTMTFAQQNASVYTERLDSVISVGESDFVKKNYDYKPNGSCTLTSMVYDVISRKLRTKNIREYNAKGLLVSNYSYQAGEINPYMGYFANEYAYDDEGRVIEEKEMVPSYNEEQTHHLNSLTKIDYSGKSGYSKVSQCDIYMSTGEYGMTIKNYYDENDNEVLMERGRIEDNGDMTVTYKTVTEYENNVKKTSTSYKSVDEGETFFIDVQDLYYATGVLKEHDVYAGDISYRFLCDYVKYDEHGNKTEELEYQTNGYRKHNTYENTYDSEGRLIDVVLNCLGSSLESFDHFKYDYKTTKDGIAYYVLTRESSFSEVDPEYNKPDVYVQKRVENGVVKSYALFSSYGDSNIECDFYSDDIKGKASASEVYKLYNGEPVCLLKYSNYKLTKFGDIQFVDMYRNPLLVENKGNDLIFVGTNEYVYDENVSGSSIFMGDECQKKLLYQTLKDSNGKEIGRTTYYYSEYKSTTTGITSVVSSADKLQSIYNLNGQKVSATQAGQMYIQNGKKFIAK